MPNCLRGIAASLTLLVAGLGLPSQAEAYRLPQLNFSESEKAMVAEEAFGVHRREAIAVDAVFSRSQMLNWEQHRTRNLSQKEKKAVQTWKRLASKLEYWTYVAGLKKVLLEISRTPSPAIDREADRLAKRVVDTLYELSHEYRIVGTPRLQNVLIKLGIRRKGYCYHYTDALRQVLHLEPWYFYAFHWAEAYGGTRRESNSLAITFKESPFETGVVIDAWRSGSRPFWHAVKDDHWPWKEAFDVLPQE
ncbi:MAG: hypothetical protein HY540_08055 [Deltaproteobacteria bacterium]|nr:hypothetical protein [Deltaproteobacteria bacterium]